ncbi:MAG: acetolactate synthase small subunit [Pseudomonadota bacterium]|nr:acetolactate synthase small subunit [Pseudomonadota bacterium]MEA3333249.1 acetolactate synthase small subunit [Pseudomonadota bacterium]
MKHIISVLVENEFGVLSRIASLFSGRGFNIESLTVAETDDSTVSSMTIVTQGADHIIEQITKQLNKLINVIKVVELTESVQMAREMVLLKFAVTSGAKRLELLHLVEVYQGRVLELGSRSLIVELTGERTKIDAALEVLAPFGIKEMSRTGMVALARDSVK